MKEGWVKKRLSEVTTKIGSGATPRGGDESYKAEGISLIRSLYVYDDGFREAKLARIDEDQANALSNVVVEPQDVLLNITGASVARCCRAPAELLPARVNQHVSIIRPVQERLDSDFLHYLLISKDYKNRLLSTGEEGGSTRQAITKAQLLDFVVDFPDSLPEQQRIVALLDEAFAGLATAKSNAERNLQNARALFDSHLEAVFSQRGEGSVETTLGEIGKVCMCKRIFKEETTAQGDIPFYKIGTFGKEPDAFIPIHIYNEYRTSYPFPKKGAVLVSASGTIGRRVRYDGEPAYFQDSNIVWIDNNESQVLNNYLYHFYGACAWNSTSGATISRLYSDNLRRISIRFPSSLHEQGLIVSQLDELAEETQRLTRLYERKLAALEELKKSLLHQAFNGEL